MKVNSGIGPSIIRIRNGERRTQQGGQDHVKIPLWYGAMLHWPCQREASKQKGNVRICGQIIFPMSQYRSDGRPMRDDCCQHISIVKQAGTVLAEVSGPHIKNIEVFLPCNMLQSVASDPHKLLVMSAAKSGSSVPPCAGYGLDL